MILPYRTDAPMYHYPIGTGLFVITCIVIHVLRFTHDITFQTLALPLGQGITPLAWITNHFVHVDYWHLLINLWFLWLFGLIVEGKVGFLRFGLIVLAIGVGESMVEQILMLNQTMTFSGGSSVIVFGLMAMSLIWAPDNEVECLIEHYWSMTTHWIQFDLTVYCFVGIYLILCVIEIFQGGIRLSSAILHAGGAGIGLGIAILMLYRGWVNCEKFDFFTRYAGILNIPDAYLPNAFVDHQTTHHEDDYEIELGEECIKS